MCCGSINTSIGSNLLLIYWIITSLENNTEIEGGVENKNWDNGIVPAGESIGTFDLVRYISSRYKNIDYEEIIIYNNNKMNIKNINTKACRESNMT